MMSSSSQSMSIQQPPSGGEVRFTHNTVYRQGRGELTDVCMLAETPSSSLQSHIVHGWGGMKG